MSTPLVLHWFYGIVLSSESASANQGTITGAAAVAALIVWGSIAATALVSALIFKFAPRVRFYWFLGLGIVCSWISLHHFSVRWSEAESSAALPLSSVWGSAPWDSFTIPAVIHGAALLWSLIVLAAVRKNRGAKRIGLVVFLITTVSFLYFHTTEMKRNWNLRQLLNTSYTLPRDTLSETDRKVLTPVESSDRVRTSALLAAIQVRRLSPDQKSQVLLITAGSEGDDPEFLASTARHLEREPKDFTPSGSAVYFPRFGGACRTLLECAAMSGNIRIFLELSRRSPGQVSDSWAVGFREAARTCRTQFLRLLVEEARRGPEKVTFPLEESVRQSLRKEYTNFGTPDCAETRAYLQELR